MLLQIDLIPGAGIWPSHDWNGKPFSPSHYPRWHKLAGTELAGGWRGILDGIQGDQDFLHKVFHFKRFMANVCDFVCLLFWFFVRPFWGFLETTVFELEISWSIFPEILLEDLGIPKDGSHVNIVAQCLTSLEMNLTLSYTLHMVMEQLTAPRA